ncbi:MAG: lipid A deacylase LpxR family protein [Gammaproteobacteria bacterium]|nr:lipid A deacylase LpxR family protein [Gammaproteobacteria bacterium]
MLALLLAMPARADGVFDISWDNDLLAGTDQGYTNGIRFSYLDALDLDDSSPWHALPGFDAQAEQAAVWSLQQYMVTPEDITTTAPVFDDLPYLGYLGISGSIWNWQGDRLSGYGLTLGVIGPNSGAENTQRQVHRLIGSTIPQGWDNQIGEAWTLGVAHYGAIRYRFNTAPGDLEKQWVWGYETTAGNWIVNAQLGGIFRIGRNIPGNFIPDYSGRSAPVALPGLYSANATQSGWSFFAGAAIEAVPYAYLEDHHEPFVYEQERLIGHVGFGLNWYTPGFDVTLILRANSNVSETRPDPLRYGTIAFTWTLE